MPRKTKETNDIEKESKKTSSEVWHFFSKKFLLSIDNAYFFCKIFRFPLACRCVLCYNSS
jgi:hypothetical protein